MRLHNRIVVANFSATLPEIADKLFAAIELSASWLVAIEIANETNSESDVVQIVAVDVAAVDLASPTVSDFNLSISGRSPVADHEMVSESVLHPSKMAVVIIKGGGVSLTSSAVMNHDVLPAAPGHWSAVDLSAN